MQDIITLKFKISYNTILYIFMKIMPDLSGIYIFTVNKVLVHNKYFIYNIINLLVYSTRSK